MMTMNRKTIILATAAILVFTASLALAQGQGYGRGSRGQGQGVACQADGRGARWDRLAERLELTEEQQTAIEELRTTNREQNLELRKDLARLRNEIEGELLKDDPDQGAALKLSDEIGDLHKQMRTNHLETRLAVREQLTSEQRDKMLAMKSGSGKRGGRGRGGDGEGPRRGGRGHGGWGECRFDND